MSRTNLEKSNLASAYFASIGRVSLHTTDPGSTGINELSGGSPAYARKTPPAATMNTTGGGSFQVTFDVPSGVTVAGAGLWDASGNYLDGGAVTAVQFTAQGQYVLTVSYQQS